MNCEQLTECVIASKEEKIVDLGVRLAALESESHPRRYMSCPDSRASWHAAAGRVATQLHPSRDMFHGGSEHKAIDEGVPLIARSHPTHDHCMATCSSVVGQHQLHGHTPPMSLLGQYMTEHGGSVPIHAQTFTRPYMSSVVCVVPWMRRQELCNHPLYIGSSACGGYT